MFFLLQSEKCRWSQLNDLKDLQDQDALLGREAIDFIELHQKGTFPSLDCTLLLIHLCLPGVSLYFHQ